MKIRNRLTLLSSTIFGLVFSVASFSVYFIFNRSSQHLIFEELEKSSRFTAFFFLEEDELTQKEYAEVEKSFLKINRQVTEVRIFDAENRIAYGMNEAEPNINEEVLEAVRNDKQLSFRVGEDYYLGIFYPDNQGDFVVVVKESHSDFHQQSRLLLVILFVVFLIGLIAIILLSRALSDWAYQPISKVIKEVESIDMSSLDRRLSSIYTKDEVEQLVSTFNELLQRLDQTTVVQRNFIKYVSHEIKTPLAAIAGNLEVFAQKSGRASQEQERVVREVVENVHQINAMLSTLMELAGLKEAHGHQKAVRIDELLWELLAQKPFSTASQLEVEVNVPPEKVDLLQAQVNPSQLRIGLANILENALKYAAGKPVRIVLSVEGGQLQLGIHDEGQGIQPKDMKFIKTPFYRGKNAKGTQGSGVGLALASLVFEKNNLSMHIDSALGKGTSVYLLFPAVG